MKAKISAQIDFLLQNIDRPSGTGIIPSGLFSVLITLRTFPYCKGCYEVDVRCLLRRPDFSVPI